MHVNNLSLVFENIIRVLTWLEFKSVSKYSEQNML